MSNGKSPGLDGFTSEFCKFFWIDIQIHAIKSLDVAYENSLLSVSQKQGLITCLPSFVYWNISFCNIIFVQTKSA
jgi:hypothetical protein